MIKAHLDQLLELDQPTPSTGFDADFKARLAAETGDLSLDQLDQLLELDQPAPSAGFDADFKARLAATPRARRRLAWIGALAAAAALALGLWWPRAEAPRPEEAPMLAHLDLLEVYEEVDLLDALEDEDTFEAVAQLHTLEVTR
ncbi:hypothetical protein KKF91_12235 [Myxococcota bacterium]|nr:hypothetical protein [Myxococcota bacterium]